MLAWRRKLAHSKRTSNSALVFYLRISPTLLEVDSENTAVYTIAMKNYTYPNNAEWANRIGWARLPDRCIGREAMPYVRHEHDQGRFVYTCHPGNLVDDTAALDAIVLR